MPDIYTPYQLADDGSVIDPPVIAEYERKLLDATSLGDETQIELVTEDYHKERERVAKRHNSKVKERQREDDRLLAEARRNAAQDQEDAAKAHAVEAERAEAARLRAEKTVPKKGETT